MDVLFADEKSALLFSRHSTLVQRYGEQGASKIALRLQQLAAAPTLAHLRNLPGRCHALADNRSGQFAVDVQRPDRLVFEPVRPPAANSRDEGDPWAGIDSVMIVGVVDFAREGVA